MVKEKSRKILMISLWAPHTELPSSHIEIHVYTHAWAHRKTHGHAHCVHINVNRIKVIKINLSLSKQKIQLFLLLILGSMSPSVSISGDEDMLRVTEAHKRNRAVTGVSPGWPPHPLSCEPVSSCFFVFYPPPSRVLFNCCMLLRDEAPQGCLLHPSPGAGQTDSRDS